MRYPGGLTDIAYNHHPMTQGLDVMIIHSFLNERMVDPRPPRTFHLIEHVGPSVFLPSGHAQPQTS